MGDGSKIEWTDATWNPIVGCSRVSPGCDHCYAVPVVHRQMSAQHKGLTVVTDDGVDWNGRINVVEHLIDQPLRWRRPRRIFVNSLSDLFHPAVPDSFIHEVFAVMGLASRHTFQVLTKRPQRARQLLSTPDFAADVLYAAGRLGQPVELGGLGQPTGRTVVDHFDRLTPEQFPLANVWLGVSIENNRYAWRADYLRDTPAAVRWVSAEPLLGPLDQLDLTGIDWVVAGGESGPGARPMHPDWVRDLRDRCINYRCRRCGGSFSLPRGMSCPDHEPRRTAFHFKQWGDWGPWTGFGGGRVGVVHTNGEWYYDGAPGLARVKAGDWVIQRHGKKVAGRELDGRTWDEYPGGAR